MTRGFEADRPRSVRGGARRWALAGAAWGLVSLLLDFGGLFTCYGILYRDGYEWLYRVLVLLVPSRWVREYSFESPLDILPIWVYLPLVVLLSIALSVLAALGLRVVVHGAGRLLRAPRGAGRGRPG